MPQAVAETDLKPIRCTKWKIPAPASDRLVQLLEQLDVKVFTVNEPGYFRPRTTRCGAILSRLLDEHGEAHVVTLVRTIVESKGNETALREPIILGLSEVILAYPHWPEKNGLAWIEAFDAIPLLQLKDRAFPMRAQNTPMRASIAGMLVDRLFPIFEPPPPAPEEPPARALIEIGQKLMKHADIHPTWTDRQLAIDLGVHEGSGACSAWMRAARLYGDRIDLVAPLSGAALKALVSPTLPESVRFEAERMLEEGKRISGGMLQRMAAAVAESPRER